MNHPKTQSATMKKCRNICFTLLLLCASIHSFAGFSERLAEAAIALTRSKVTYDPAYKILTYPNGDVAADRGVCSDVVIRAYRQLGIDLQQRVHEDMATNFNAYPAMWGLKKPDKNIDHRRVQNLMCFFTRKGAAQPISLKAEDYKPGDIVCWRLAGGLVHIGIVVKERSADQLTPLIVHNIGAGQVMEDCLFKFNIIGHYRYSGAQ